MARGGFPYKPLDIPIQIALLIQNNHSLLGIMISTALAISSLFVAARAQQAGTLTTETHPALTVSQCTSSGCTTSAQSIVIDANWRWLHTVTGYTNCYTGNLWNTTICPDGVTCAANCALDGGSCYSDSFLPIPGYFKSSEEDYLPSSLFLRQTHYRLSTFLKKLC